MMASKVAGSILLAASISLAQTDWPVYGHDSGGSRYSPLTQINTTNVSRLKPAWQYGIDTGVDNSPANRVLTGPEPFRLWSMASSMPPPCIAASSHSNRKLERKSGNT